MKKQLLTLLLFACSFSLYGMRSRSRVYTEGSEKHYHPCWQKFKHLCCCPCSMTFCAKAIEGLQTANSTLVKAHLTHVNSISDEGKTAFDYLLDCPEIERYPAIYDILLAKGFNPLIKHGTKRATIYDIIDMKNLELFQMSASPHINEEEKCKEIIRYVYRKIDERPLEKNTFECQVLGWLSQKNPIAVTKATLERRADRARRTTVSGDTVDNFSRHEDLIRHYSETTIPHFAWQ